MGRKCVTKNCRGLGDRNRPRCCRCAKRLWREKNPVRDAYLNLKHHAKWRGVGFALSLQEFSDFCESTSYIQNKGRTGDALAVDRIDGSRGYEVGNIRVLTCSENSRREHAEAYEEEPF